MLLAAREDRADARDQFIETLMPLIGSVARIYSRVPAVERAELMQEGVVGALRALERYDPNLGTPFWAYASWWVRQAMQQLVSELSRPVVLSDRALRQLARMREARSRYMSMNAREPSLVELARASGLTVEQLQKLTVAERQPRGLQEPVDASAGAGASTFGETLSDPRAEEAYDELATRLGAAEVPRLLERLSERERVVIKARYGLAGPERTLRELGLAMGVSAERVRQIEQGALESMRSAFVGAAGDAAASTLKRGARGSRRTPTRAIRPTAAGSRRRCAHATPRPLTRSARAAGS